MTSSTSSLRFASQHHQVNPRFHDWEALGPMKVGTWGMTRFVFSSIRSSVAYESYNLYRWRCRRCGQRFSSRSEAVPRRHLLERVNIEVECPRTQWERLMGDETFGVRDRMADVRLKATEPGEDLRDTVKALISQRFECSAATPWSGCREDAPNGVQHVDAKLGDDGRYHCPNCGTSWRG